MKIKRVGIILCVLGLSGCALGRGVRLAYKVGEKRIYEAECNGTARTIGSCYEQASEACSGDFEIVDKDGSSSLFKASSGQLIPIVKRSILFSCSTSQ